MLPNSWRVISVLLLVRAWGYFGQNGIPESGESPGRTRRPNHKTLEHYLPLMITNPLSSISDN
jgi:hypothetical protein